MSPPSSLKRSRGCPVFLDWSEPLKLEPRREWRHENDVWNVENG